MTMHTAMPIVNPNTLSKENVLLRVMLRQAAVRFVLNIHEGLEKHFPVVVLIFCNCYCPSNGEVKYRSVFSASGFFAFKNMPASKGLIIRLL